MSRWGEVGRIYLTPEAPSPGATCSERYALQGASRHGAAARSAGPPKRSKTPKTANFQFFGVSAGRVGVGAYSGEAPSTGIG